MRVLSLLLGLLVGNFLAANQTDHDQLCNDKYVCCDLAGGLGNQMCQVAAALAYAWDHNATPIFPDLNKSNVNIPLHKATVFRSLCSLLELIPYWTYYHQKQGVFSLEYLPNVPNLRLAGGFQNYLYFHHHYQNLLNTFTPTEDTVKILKLKYNKLITHPNTVAVHVRTFNSKIHYSGPYCKFVGLKYYAKAMDKFPDPVIFVIFSDRINWCKKHFTQFKRKCVFIEGNNEIEDLFLSSMMKHHIIPNSTFSFWAAYLNKNPNKRVIAPKYIHDNEKWALCLPEWESVLPHYKTKYPLDMTWHDKNSWDGN